MKRHVSGLSKADPAPDHCIPDGVFLVRVERAQYRWHAQKPYFSVLFLVLEPEGTRGRRFTGRLYATPRALWKLNWFLSDFGYDAELLGRDEIDQKSLVGLCGVIKIIHTVVSGTSLLTLDCFAPREKWSELFSGGDAQGGRTQVAS